MKVSSTCGTLSTIYGITNGLRLRRKHLDATTQKRAKKIGEWQARARDFTEQTNIARDRAREWIATKDGKKDIAVYESDKMMALTLAEKSGKSVFMPPERNGRIYAFRCRCYRFFTHIRTPATNVWGSE